MENEQWEITTYPEDQQNILRRSLELFKTEFRQKWTKETFLRKKKGYT